MVHKIATLLLLLCLPVRAAVVVAASGGYIDVSNAVNQAGFGGTVWVPTNSAIAPGTNQWQAGLVLTNVSLLASNPVSILFTNNSAVGIQMGCSGSFVVVSNFIFDIAPSGPTAHVIGIDGSNVCFRVTRCTFLNSSTGVGSGTQFGIFIGEANSLAVNGPWGLIDNDNFQFPGGPVYNYICEYQNGSLGSGSWSNNMTWGTTNCVVVESCNFSQPSQEPQSSLVEGFGGARMTVRYNNITNICETTHGENAAAGAGGLLQQEFYMNNWILNDPNNQNALPFLYWLRGGTSVLWSNNIVNNSAAGRFALGEFAYYSVECASSNLFQQEFCPRQLLYPADYPAVEQVGQGVVNGSQGRVPVYVWGNTLPAVALVEFQLGTDGGDVPFIQQNRDIYTNTPMPNYTPLVFPYPIAGASNPPPIVAAQSLITPLGHIARQALLH